MLFSNDTTYMVPTRLMCYQVLGFEADARAAIVLQLGHQKRFLRHSSVCGLWTLSSTEGVATLCGMLCSRACWQWQMSIFQRREVCSGCGRSCLLCSSAVGSRKITENAFRASRVVRERSKICTAVHVAGGYQLSSCIRASTCWRGRVSV